MFDTGGEYDQGLGSSKMLQFIDKMIELDRCLKCNFNQHGVVTRDTVALHHIWNRADERIEFLFLVRFYFKIDKRFDMIAKEQVIDPGMIAGDDTCFFHTLDSG